MTVTKKGMMLEISSNHINKLDEMDEYLSDKPHVNRVRKAIVLQIEEMGKHPNWLKYLDSQNGNNPNMGGVT